MSEKIILHFNLLGAFLYEGQPLKLGRKALSFLQYLIVYHERNISSAELIEEFWGEGSDDPASALRRMILKARKLLRELCPGRTDLLLTLPDCYAWNPEVEFALDTKQFETACLEAGKKADEEKEELLLSAVSLYKGDFLAANDDAWAGG